MVQYAEYDDAHLYASFINDEDIDEVETALYEQNHLDRELAWKVQVHEFAHALRNFPLPDTPFCEEFRKRFKIEFAPLPMRPTPGQLRNLFSDAAQEDARSRIGDPNPDVAWFAGQFLHWLTEAMGRYCYNDDCLKPLPSEPKRRGRPRYYCPDLIPEPNDPEPRRVNCKENAKHRRAYHEKNPNAARRFRPMIVPGIPFSSRDPYRIPLEAYEASGKRFRYPSRLEPDKVDALEMQSMDHLETTFDDTSETGRMRDEPWDERRQERPSE